MSDGPETLRIGLVAHHVFCPRRAWLEVHGEKTDTGQMAVGVDDHAAVDDPTTSRTTRLRAVDLRSQRLGLAGRADSVEIAPDGGTTVVEHKAAPVRRSADPTPAQRVQLALHNQARCLTEAGHRVDGAAVWNSTLRRRVPVLLDDDLFAEAEQHVEACRRVLRDAKPPAPLEDDSRCASCSHVSVCLPDEHRARVPARRIGIADPAGRVLHLASPGSRASLRRGQIEVRVRDQDPRRVPLEQTAGLVVHGNADVSSALLREMLERGYPIVWCAWSGRVVGWATPAGGPNSAARRLQYGLGAEAALSAAQSIVAAKIRNQAAILRRHKIPARGGLVELAKLADRQLSTTALLGLEGGAAARYFASMSGVLKPSWAGLSQRRGRPAPDPVNAGLNLVYGLLVSDLLRAVVACGLDPARGVLHTATSNKPALALDLMEEFRAPVADSALIWAINNGEVRERDFRQDLDAVRLTQRGRTALIGAYERRATTEFQHPVYGYRVTWRRAMEVQARMFLALVLGETTEYRAISLR